MYRLKSTALLDFLKFLYSGPQLANLTILWQKFFTHPQVQDGHIGILASADRGREQRSAKELIDLFDEVAELYFPAAPEKPANEETDSSAPLTLEQELAQEMAELKKSKNKRSKRFSVYVLSTHFHFLFISHTNKI